MPTRGLLMEPWVQLIDRQGAQWPVSRPAPLHLLSFNSSLLSNPSSSETLDLL